MTAAQNTSAVDVRDMLVVHTALLREFRLAPAAVRRVRDADTRQRDRVDEHLELLCTLMHHHHEGEDELLWPLLRERLTGEDAAMLDVVEAQHAGIDTALTRVEDARSGWCEAVDATTTRRLASALEDLFDSLRDHLEVEERSVLPLAAVHLEPAEWHAVGEAGAASVPKSAMPLVIGMFAYEGDPAVLRDMLRPAPAPIRVLVPRIAPRVYARRALAVHGTRTP
ncbi:hemerythrin domain-containing protein [Williamsia serinedens]|uniref:Hemerythrin HHE cation binding domain-containing protein n=1 Tax=Williamsia serinedens TaxID=391736 RepID=A0ABT1H2S7_9NOCA|nr:hemerythrin domain-containing protein [Williamsia serinedens]MCP2160132.1 Hemerythrin HHE cation binding domain-containing protein [Williamsia serinedens]